MRKRKFRLARYFIVAVIISMALLVNIAANRDDVVQAQSLTKVFITVKSDGIQQEVHTSQKTVSAALKEFGVDLGPLDKVSPSRNGRVKENMKISVVRVTQSIESTVLPMTFKTIKNATRSLKPGQTKEIQAGANGEKQVNYLVRYEDGKPVKRTKTGVKVLKQPENRVVSIGERANNFASRGSHKVRKVVRMVATGYDPGPRSCGRYATGRTSIGLKAGRGVCAVDPKVIPYRTRLYIEGYGYAIAGDCGGAIKGNRIDLGFNSYSEAIRFGRKTVIVHILE